MAHTSHGHYIFGSYMSADDKPHIRLAKNCGGMDFCSDCRAEGELWRREHPQQVEKVEDYMSKYPSSKVKNHTWFDSLGTPVIAWQVSDILAYFENVNDFPPDIREIANVLEIDLTGQVLRHIMGETFQVLRDSEWLVRFGRELNIVTNAFFRENYSQNREELPSAKAVDHPSHYGGDGNPYEAIKVIEAWDLGFHLGNTVKYIARAGKKDPKKLLEDLEKSLWYLQRKVDLLKEAENEN